MKLELLPRILLLRPQEVWTGGDASVLSAEL